MLEGHTLVSILPQSSTTLINTSFLFWRVKEVLVFIVKLKLVALDDGQDFRKGFYCIDQEILVQKRDGLNFHLRLLYLVVSFLQEEEKLP